MLLNLGKKNENRMKINEKYGVNYNDTVSFTTYTRKCKNGHSTKADGGSVGIS